jgi:undecaprenyl pyrophosphate synthase
MKTLTERHKRLARFAKIPALVTETKKKPTAQDLDGAMKKFAGKLRRTKTFGRIQVEIAAGGKSDLWTYELTDGAAKLSKHNAADPTLKVCVNQEDAWAILQGVVSPAEIYLMGRMLIVGSCDLAREVYELVGSRGETEIR